MKCPQEHQCHSFKKISLNNANLELQCIQKYHHLFCKLQFNPFDKLGQTETML